MAKKLYVGNLPYDVSEDQLQGMFTAHGAVASVKMITDRETGQPKGFGFVEMSNDAEAQSAIEKLNGTMVGNRKIVVNEARPMEPRKPGMGGGGYRGGGGGGDRGGWRK